MKHMSANPSVAIEDMSDAASSEASHAALHNTMRVQRIQDFFFHKLTLLFAASVLVVLIGIIVSLVIGAAPALV